MIVKRNVGWPVDGLCDYINHEITCLVESGRVNIITAIAQKGRSVEKYEIPVLNQTIDVSLVKQSNYINQ